MDYYRWYMMWLVKTLSTAVFWLGILVVALWVVGEVAAWINDKGFPGNMGVETGQYRVHIVEADEVFGRNDKTKTVDRIGFS